MPSRDRWRILAVGIAHAEVLATLHDACFPRGWRADSFAALLVGPGVDATLAHPETSDEPVAFLLTRRAADEAEILTLGVLPDARRQGAAGALLGEAMNRLAAEGASALWLEVAESNRAAIGLYRAFGFREAGRRKRYYETGPGAAEDALVFAVLLEPAVP